MFLDFGVTEADCDKEVKGKEVTENKWQNFYMEEKRARFEQVLDDTG